MARRVVVALLDLYRWGISPLMGPSCRFTPSCSAYTQEAVSRHGVLTGLVLGIMRIARCHPYHPGGFDPVPDHPWAGFLRCDKERG